MGTDGDGLRWTIRESFFRYVTALDDGEVRWDPTAPPGWFPLLARPDGPLPADAPAAELRFGGGVVLTGHAGLLDARITDPVVDLAAGVLTIPDPRRGDRYALAELPGAVVGEADGVWICRVEAPRLASDATALFGGFYGRGEPLDPLVIEIRRG